MPDQVARREPGARRGDDEPAVPKDRDPIAQLEDFLEPVVHEQDPDPACARLASDDEQAVDLVRGERRGGLIEHQDSGVDREGTGDLDELLIGHRETADRRGHIEADAQLVEQRIRRSPHRTPVDRPESADRLVSEEHVLGNREVGEEARLLVDDRDAERTGLGGAVDVLRPAVEQDRATVGRIQSGEQLHERALAGAVLPDECMHLAGQDLEGHAIEGLCGSEALRDIPKRGPRWG